MKSPILILVTVSLILAGCSSIPPISAGSAKYESTHPFGSTSIGVEGARVTDARVEVDSYHRKSRWGWAGVTVVSQDVTITQYARDRKPGEEAKIDAP